MNWWRGELSGGLSLHMWRVSHTLQYRSWNTNK